MKVASEKGSFTDKGAPARLTADFSSETMEARRQWDDISKMMIGKDCQPRILYPEKVFFKKNEREILDKLKVRAFVSSRPRKY